MSDWHQRDPLREVVRDVFSIQQLYPFQRLVISNTIEGIDQLVVFPTGGGKSLCFQVPCVFLVGRTLVVTPLLSLLKDQVGRLRELGLPVAVLTGAMSTRERETLRRAVSTDKTRLIYATPEAAIADSNREYLRTLTVSHLVVDEAHCLAEWGSSFRPAYLRLPQLIADLNVPIVSAYTATASHRVLALLREILFQGRTVNTVASDPDRPNIRYAVVPVLSKQRGLFQALQSCPRPALVFARTRKRVEEYARFLKRRAGEVEVFFYHAGLSREERQTVEDWYVNSQTGVLFATSAYGMGIDKNNIRSVVHLDLPRSVEAYLQQTGRGGRDGQQAQAHLLYSADDILFLSDLADDDNRYRYLTMLQYALGVDVCRRKFLLSYLDRDTPYCAGCDHCSGTVRTRPEGMQVMVHFVRHNKRRFTLRQALRILAGKHDIETVTRLLDGHRSYGHLASWQPDELEEALGGLVAASIVDTPTRGPWKGRLTMRKTASSWNQHLNAMITQIRAEQVRREPTSDL